MKVDDTRMAALLGVARQYGEGDIIRMGIEDLCADLNDARDGRTALDDALNAAHAWLVTECGCEHARIEQVIVDARNEARATE
jgi:hypothetical protein